nr:MAG TPA: hypothetical protein [Caudoviricetes sp.]
MSFYEMHILIQKLYYKNLNSWEQTRQLAFISAKTLGGIKTDSPQKFMPFSWDSVVDNSDNDNTAPTEEDKKRLIEKAKKYGTRISDENTT